MQRGKSDSTNQKNYPDLGNGVLSIWNFCARFSDVIWQGKPVVTSPNVGCFSQVTKVRVRVTVRRWYFIAKLIKVPDDLIPHLLYVNTL